MSQSAPGIRSEDLLDLINQIVEALPNMVFVKDATDLRFVLLNRAGEELVGHPREDLLGKNDYDFFPEDQAEFFTRVDREVLASGEVLDILEEPLETPRGRRWLHTKKVPLLADDGTPRYLLGISEDITERRKAEHLKDDILSVASHELRSPTAAMIGALTLLETTVGPGLDEASREMLELAKENGNRMLELLDACLDVGRLEKDQMRLHMRAVELTDLVRAAVRLNQPFADQYDVRFSLGRLAEPSTVSADPERLVQALTNFMTNAAKFSPPGGEVRVSVLPAGNQVRIEVDDDGPGIPEAFRERVFQKFARARSKECAPNEGSGLGLHIASKLVERMGGTVGFETEIGSGSTFHLELPVATTIADA